MDRNLEEGNEQSGKILFTSQKQADEFFGPEAELEVTWESISDMSFRHGRAVRDSIKMHNAIEVTVERRENDWLNSHEFTMWYGKRQKFIHKRLYGINYMHGLFYCEATYRFFNLQARVYSAVYASYEPYLKDAILSVVCH
ncbi:MAG: hypothetical protein ACTSU5_12390 [Promethearchaeota archaeon]